jgi:leucyl-tRNA synthetase
MGVTYLAVAAEHPLALKALETKPELSEFINSCKKMESSEAAMETMEKRGIDSGMIAIHPISGEQVPVWIANFVLMSYGTGAVMSVPALTHQNKIGYPDRNLFSRNRMNSHYS